MGKQFRLKCICILFMYPKTGIQQHDPLALCHSINQYLFTMPHRHVFFTQRFHLSNQCGYSVDCSHDAHLIECVDKNSAFASTLGMSNMLYQPIIVTTRVLGVVI